MILFIHGEDTYQSHQRLEFLKQGFIKKYDPQSHNVFVFDSDDFSFEAFHRAVASFALFRSKRFVIVKGLFRKGHQTLFEQVSSSIEKGISDDIVLIFWEDYEVSVSKPSKKAKKSTAQHNPLFTLLSKLPHHEVYRPLSSSDAAHWVQKEALRLGGSFAPQTAGLLVNLVGVNLWQLHNEVVKLVHYVSKRPVRLEDVLALVQANFSENIFALMDAVSRKDSQNALSLLHQQLESGIEEVHIISMLARQIKILLLVKDALATSSQSGVIATQLGLHPFVVKKALQQIRGFSAEELRNLYMAVVDIDEQGKSLNIPVRTLLEMFVLKMCGQAIPVS